MIFDKNLTWKSYICSPHLSDVATWPWEVQKSFSTVLFIYTSDYLWYRRRKQLIHFSWRKAAHLNPAVGGHCKLPLQVRAEPGRQTLYAFKWENRFW